MTPPDFRVYVLHIRDCCEQLAECRTLRERGGVPEPGDHRGGFQEGRAGVPRGSSRHPLGKMNDLRNVLIHNYEGADEDLVWAIVNREIPALLLAVHRILDECPS